MPDTCRLYLDQMLRHEVAQALRDEGHDVLRATHFKNYLVILSPKRSKWVYTA